MCDRRKNQDRENMDDDVPDRQEKLSLELLGSFPETEKQLQVALHELSVHQEELRAQNEELRNTQDDLEASRRLYIDLFDFAPVGYFMLDANALIHKINITGADMLGVDRRRLHMKPFVLHVEAGDRDLFRRHLRIVFDTGKRHAQEIKLLKNGGEVFHARLESVFTEEESMRLCRTSVSDVTEKKAAEHALTAYNELLEKRVEERTAELKTALSALQQEIRERGLAMEALREKEQLLLLQSRQAAMGEMINNIAHQWRQPLNALALVIQTFSMDHELGKVTGESASALERNAMDIINHMSQTIDDFRNYFKPDKSKVSFHVTRAVSRTVSLVRDSFKSQKIAIEVNAADEPLINGYPSEFCQVLLNILTNARDALQERRVCNPRITIDIRTEAGRTVVTIKDNAGGIPERLIDRIFDPYFTTKEPDKGTGVGLFMSKGIIEKSMGGRISARNIADGAEFRIEV